MAAVSTGEIDQLNPIDGSELVQDFVASTDWSNTSGDPLRPAWRLDGAASTTYGATDPGEDMAESVAMVVMGLGDLIPDDQRAWVERWLESPSDSLALGQPWAPAGSEEVLVETPLFDADEVARLQGSLPRAEPLYFALPTSLGATEDIVDLVESRLRTRVMAGGLDPILDDRVPRHGGRFSGPDGRLWWVELWDFRFAAPGISSVTTPILVYVAVW